MSDKIYLIGHKSPDLDSVAGPIAYAELKNKLEKNDIYVPACSEKKNKETAYVLEKFGFFEPELLDDATGKNLILIDHNEASQSPNNIDKAKIVEILDHHKLNFSYSDPIEVNIKPWGASCTIIFEEFKKNNIAVEKNIAGLMLSAILIDTVITKSPTTTEKDKQAIIELAESADISNWQEFGMELFKVRSSVSELSDTDIIKYDFKDFEMKGGKLGIGQIETVDLKDFESREVRLFAELELLRQSGGYHSTILVMTDIINEGSKLLVSSGDMNAINKAFDVKIENNQIYIPGIISRKKQVISALSKILD